MNTQGKTSSKSTNYFPPVVSVLGHVDHGKTTLLDAIRKTNIAQREHGGITQRIGASGIEIVHEEQKRRITFIDTPGHEAFSKMRSRGAIVADIGLLIIAANDGIKPQTRESIQILKESKLPFIVVITKSDLPEAQSEKVKQQLLKENIMVESYGGDVPVIEVSAKTGRNIKELLELILLVFDLNAAQILEEKNNKGEFKGIIIESKLDPKAGPKATIIIKNGILEVKDQLVSDNITAKVKTIIDDRGIPLKSATIGDAVEILGFENVPNVGAVVYKKSDMAIEKRENILPQLEKNELDLIDRNKLEQSELSIILRTDTEGSLEAIVNALPDSIFVVSKKTGEITIADILLAKSTECIVIGFNTKIAADVSIFAKTEKVLVKNYTIIYELLDELKDVLEGKALAAQEEILGKAKILATFPYEKTTVLGISVLEGRVAKGDQARIIRADQVIGESFVNSLRQGKSAISKVEKGQEAGIIISPQVDFTIGDMIIFHR